MLNRLLLLGRLKIDYKGIIHEKMKGFYRSKQADGAYGACTHFEPTGARMALPCWDEPAFKGSFVNYDIQQALSLMSYIPATFDISLRVPANKTALSNMDVREKKLDKNGLKTLHFKTTPLMSTYLVAFAVGDFDFVEDKISVSDDRKREELTVRVYTPAGKREQVIAAVFFTELLIIYTF